ncbi:MAG: imidazole glycerol phosphate synthase subunit HisH [Terriglobales bacterium]
MIAIIDYRAGNLTSVKKATDRVGSESIVTADAEIVARATKIILPGVGHFASTAALNEHGMRSAISEALHRGVPFLGICLGLQWLLDSSQEAPELTGFGIWHAACERFPGDVKSPHVGWNQLQIRNGSSRLLSGIASGSFVYFTHSFRVPILASTTAECEYSGRFSAVVERNNVFGVQFHPEKSGPAGLKLLENFCAM